MEQLSDYASLESSIKTALVASTRGVNQIANEDLTFHRSLDPSLGTKLDVQNARLLGLAERLLGSATAHTESVRPSLKDIDDVEGNWSKVVDVVDSLLERADTALDEFTGAVKRLSPGREGTPTSKLPKPPSRIAAALKNQDIEKPQLLFNNVPTNRDTGPFKPLLQTKPHARTGLATEPVASNLPNSQPAYPHPYQLEIEEYAYPAFVSRQSAPIPYPAFESTTAIFVDTEDAFEKMLQELTQAKEIAIDLEHHDTRSYIGIVSLMQISTRNQDWIVDTLVPWRRNLSRLNEVFTDSRILKVLHGAYMDIMWLQRDLGLYIVGLFDTHFASRALGYTGGSYAFLLKKFTGVDAQKQYQMADWRIRPLPQELLDYARSDTHYLLYIYDHMRNELIERSASWQTQQGRTKLLDVQERSKEESLQRYEHPIYDFELGQGALGWYKLLSRTPAMLTKEQFAVFRAVHQWRDGVAREQDDSVHYIMANHNLFSVARAIPMTRAELLGVVQPASQTVRLRADELVAAIAKAKKESVDAPEMLELLAKIEPAFGRQAAKQAAANSEGVAKFVPKPETSAPVNGAPNATSLRSTTSAFWGPAFESSAHKLQQRSMSTAPRVDLTVPLPPLSAEVFAEPTEASTPARAEAGKLPLPDSPSSPERRMTEEADEPFILSQLGKKRAAEHMDGMAAQSDEVAIPDEESERAAAKAERRKARKESKRAAKAGLGDASEDVQEGALRGANNAAAMEEEEPFDYASAPSMLHPPRPSRQELKEAKKKAVNPYAKSLDAPKGLPRAQKERAGRSMTYKS